MDFWVFAYPFGMAALWRKYISTWPTAGSAGWGRKILSRTIPPSPKIETGASVKAASSAATVSNQSHYCRNSVGDPTEAMAEELSVTSRAVRQLDSESRHWSIKTTKVRIGHPAAAQIKQG